MNDYDYDVNDYDTAQGMMYSDRDVYVVDNEGEGYWYNLELLHNLGSGLTANRWER